MKIHKALLIYFTILLSMQAQGLLSEVPNDAPIVGLGLLAPIVRTVSHVITAPVRNQARFARNRARMHHRHLLRAENPIDDNGPIIEEADSSKDRELMKNVDLSYQRERMPSKMKNNKRDEEYYLWSLNNWVPYGRTKERSADIIAIDNIYEYNKAMTENQPEMDVQLLANPSFYRQYEVVPSDKEMRNIIPQFNGMDRFQGVPVIEIDPEMFVEENSGETINYLNEDISNIDDYGSTNEENPPQELPYSETNENQQHYSDIQDGGQDIYNNDKYNIKQELYEENKIVPQENPSYSDYQNGNFVEPPNFNEEVVYNNNYAVKNSKDRNYNLNENINEEYGSNQELYNVENYKDVPPNYESSPKQLENQGYGANYNIHPQSFVKNQINDASSKNEQESFYSGSLDNNKLVPYLNDNPQIEPEIEENIYNNMEYQSNKANYPENGAAPQQIEEYSLDHQTYYEGPTKNDQKLPDSNEYAQEDSDIPENTPNFQIYEPNDITSQDNVNYFHNLKKVFPMLQEMQSYTQGNSKTPPNYESKSRSANPTDPRHFHTHQHSSTFKNWFSNDKPTFTESLSTWDYHKQPQIIVNNHNVPVNINNQNSQVAQTSGGSVSSQSQAVSNTNFENGNKYGQFHNQNFQGAQTTQGSTSTQSQTITNEASVGIKPQRLFVSNELSANTQAAKTFDGSTSNQVQTITGSSGQNNQFSLTDGGSQSSQSQTVMSRSSGKDFLSLPSPYLVDIPRHRPINQIYSRRKRSLPLVRLMTDPNAKLDMPQTLENFGTVARNSFQDKRHPMYHMKNMVGSARDVFLSALRVPPQGIVIPSQYKIIDTKKERAVPLNDYTYLDNIVKKAKSLPDEAKKLIEPIVGSTNVQKSPLTVKEKIQERISNLRATLGPKVKSRSIFSDDVVSSPISRNIKNSNNDEEFTETFQKMGNIFRDSIKSGQQTLNHITDVAHSARKVFTTSTLGAPRVVRPLMHAPAFEKKQLRFKDDPEKVTFVAPRFLDITNDGRYKETANDFIDVGDIMDALGVSNPSGNKVGLRRYVVHSKVDKSTRDGPVVGNRFGETNDIVKEGLPTKKFFVVAEDIDDNDIIANEIDTIKDLTDVIGVNSLKDLLNGMKTDMTFMKDKVMENKYKELEELQAKLAKLEEDEANIPNTEKLDDKISSDEDIDHFIKSLFTTPAPVIEKQRSKRQITHHNSHHHNLALPANLLRPFMGSPSTIELNDYFRHHNDFEEVVNDSSEEFTSDEVLQSKQDQFVEALFNPNEYISAINPKMYAKLFNEPLTFQDKYPKLDAKKTKDMVKNHNIDVVGEPRTDEDELFDEGNDNERFMKVKDKLLKPYMGKKDKQSYQSHFDYVPDFGYFPRYYGDYNQNNAYHEGSEELEEYY